MTSWILAIPFRKTLAMPKHSRLLVIPDVHQDINFLQYIFKNESLSEWDRIIFLGDFFDAKHPEFGNIASVDWICEFVIELKNTLKDRMVTLLGNHDLVFHVMSCYPERLTRQQKDMLLDIHGFTTWPSIEAAGYSFDPAFFKDVKLCHAEGGWLFSHAGVTLDTWESFCGTGAKGINATETFVSNINRWVDRSMPENGDELPIPLFQAGKTRGGFLDKGGPLWLDWDEEFEDNLPLPQIVGHTVDSTFRINGRSYCLDARQSLYARVCGPVVEPVIVPR